MEARLISFALIALTYFSLGANFATRNFVVTAPDPAFARQVAEQAERYRKELAELWLGHELPPWPQRCPIRVEISLHAGGETSFAFVPGPSGKSQPIDWRMKISGPPERLLDSVLPHEITHTIFATHYGCPLPRWADEGACTTVEHTSEKRKNHQLLLEFLTSSRGIPFNHMFAMKQYPRDILPLYSQGYSLARYLIMQRGHKHFVNYIGAGMASETPGREPQAWNKITKEYYGYNDLSELQIKWLSWVRQGSPQMTVAETSPDDNSTANNSPAVNSPATGNPAPVRPVSGATAMARAESGPAQLAAGQSWYLQQSHSGSDNSMQKPDGALQQIHSADQQYYPGSIGTVRPPRPNDSLGTVWR